MSTHQPAQSCLAPLVHSGCTIQDLTPTSQEAIEVYCEGEDMAIPQPSSIENLLDNSDYQGGVWLMVDVDIGKLSGKTVRINITVPEITLQQIDRAAKKAGVSRSRFMTDAAREKTAHQ